MSSLFSNGLWSKIAGGRTLTACMAVFSIAVAAGCAQKVAEPTEASEPTGTRAEALTGPQTVVTYQYDQRGRLRSAEYPNATKRIRVDQDKAGNRTQLVVDQTITNPDAAAP